MPHVPYYPSLSCAPRTSTTIPLSCAPRTSTTHPSHVPLVLLLPLSYAPRTSTTHPSHVPLVPLLPLSYAPRTSTPIPLMCPSYLYYPSHVPLVPLLSLSCAPRTSTIPLMCPLYLYYPSHVPLVPLLSLSCVGSHPNWARNIAITMQVNTQKCDQLTHPIGRTTVTITQCNGVLVWVVASQFWAPTQTWDILIIRERLVEAF